MKCEKSVWLGSVFPVDTKGRSPVARHTPCTGHWRRKKKKEKVWIYSIYKYLQNSKKNNQMFNSLFSLLKLKKKKQSRVSLSVWRSGTASQVLWIHTLWEMLSILQSCNCWCRLSGLHLHSLFHLSTHSGLEKRLPNLTQLLAEAHWMSALFQLGSSLAICLPATVSALKTLQISPH